MVKFPQVDMTALVHMTDEDLKALGIPMVNQADLSAMMCIVSYGAFCFL